MASVGRMVKESITSEVTARLAERPNFFVTSLNRLPADEADTLRQKLFASNARLVLIKRRLGQRAVEPLKFAGLTELLEGSVGLVLTGDDVLPTAKLIVEFHKAHEEQLTIRGAVIDGRLLSKQYVEQLASLPPRPVLLAQLVATIEAPIAGVILTLEQLIGDLAWIMEQAAAAKPAAPSAPATPAHSEKEEPTHG